VKRKFHKISVGRKRKKNKALKVIQTRHSLALRHFRELCKRRGFDCFKEDLAEFSNPLHILDLIRALADSAELKSPRNLMVILYAVEA
jgi:hypothetical protein